MEFLVIGFLLLVAAFMLWGAVSLMKLLFSPNQMTSTPSSQSITNEDIDGMNNGDYYNGPSGYSATGGYQNSFYGKQFNDDDEHKS